MIEDAPSSEWKLRDRPASTSPGRTVVKKAKGYYFIDARGKRHDEPSVLTIAVTILRRAKFHVLSATSAQEALSLCRGHPEEIHLALIDVVMPAMIGLELRECLRSEFPSIQILFMSGYNYEEMEWQGIPGGPTDFVQKPFTVDTLLEAVGAALSRPGAMHA